MLVFSFIVFFILYANSFFMKQQKKEFGMYLLYGMKERQVAAMVFFETLFFGAISVSSGIVIASLLNTIYAWLHDQHRNEKCIRSRSGYRKVVPWKCIWPWTMSANLKDTTTLHNGVKIPWVGSRPDTMALGF
jgi:ABC-type antimicrobial peptide transport system permease subunit